MDIPKDDMAEITKDAEYWAWRMLKLWRCPPRVEVEDLIQEALVAGIEAWEDYDPEKGASFKHFRRERMRIACWEQLRRENCFGKRLEHGEKWPRVLRRSPERMEGIAMDGGPDPLDRLVFQEDCAWLDEAIEELPPRYRKVLALFRAGKDLHEIAGEAGLRPKTAKEYKSQAIRDLSSQKQICH